MKATSRWKCLGLFCFFLMGISAEADEPAARTNAGNSKTAKAKLPALVTVATIDGQPVYAAEVAEAIEALLPGQQIAPRRRPRLEAEMLRQIVSQRLVLLYLQRKKVAVSEHHVDAIVRDMKSRLKQEKTTLVEHLRQRGITEQALRLHLAWRMSWEKHVLRRVTDKALERYFDAHRRDFDGTKVRVSQVLLAVKKSADHSALERATLRAKQLREQLVASELSFADAAKKHSDAPSKAKGGDQGFLTRHGEMPEVISAAAFALQPGEMSQPLVSPFGVHLLKCTEVESGKGTWQEALGPLRQAVLQRGFRSIVERERPRVEIRYTGAMAYYRSGSDESETEELVLPKGK